MIVPIAISEKLDLMQPYVSNVANTVKQTVISYCEDNGFAYTSRLKTAESLAEKLETGRFKSWSSLDDLFACSIIIPTLLYEADVITFLEKVFVKVILKKRGESQKDPSVFRFDATRFVGRIRVSDKDGINEQISIIQFEIQIRSAFEHAWSVTTHALAYKADKVDWQSLRLASQLKASVEQLDGLVLAFEQAAGVVQSHPWPEVAIKIRLEMLFKELIGSRLIPPEFTPGNWQRFCDNLYSLLRAGSKKNKHQLESVIQQVEDAIRDEVNVLGFEKFPRSISLMQFILGVLTNRNIISGPYNNYIPLITDPLLLLYPEVKKEKDFFDFQN